MPRPESRTGIAAILLALLVGALTGVVNAATIYDVTTDWSDAANPASTWSYRESVNLLPHVDAWTGLTGDFSTAQPAWARSATSNMKLPCIFRSSATVAITHDWLTGDVITHSTDNANGVGAGAANIAWTSPIDGTIDIAGNVWMGRDIGRGNQWRLSLNGTLLTGGTIGSGDAYSRATPFQFSAGSGGASAVDDVAVAVGDLLMLEIIRTSTLGDYVGIRWTIDATATPTGLDDAAAGDALWLGHAAPNPSAGAARIRFRIPADSRVSLDVYDLAGRRVAEALAAFLPAGAHSIEWDGRDAAGRAVPSGTYVYRLVAGERIATGRLALVR
ncbi:MAG: FlgD immunoglobulin-like domain containing protein [bacterium]